MCEVGRGVFPWPGETLIPVMPRGGARKNTHVPPKPRAPWKRTGGLAASGVVGTAGKGAMESALSRK